jgi:hypothetical protein
VAVHQVCIPSCQLFTFCKSPSDLLNHCVVATFRDWADARIFRKLICCQNRAQTALPCWLVQAGNCSINSITALIALFDELTLHSSGQMIVVSDTVAEPDGVGLLQGYDGSDYWGEWCKGERHGWGVRRTIDGECEYRGEFRNGHYCGLGVLREGAVTRSGRWVDGTLVLRQRLSSSALFAARDAAIRAGQLSPPCYLATITVLTTNLS